MNDQQAYNFRSMGNSQYHQEVPQIDFECADGKPLQLVKITPNNKFELVQETADHLLTFNEGIAICSIVGKYRTGKSFLMNKLLSLGSKRFQVSGSVNACTKGIWIWSKPLYNENGNFNIFFMDSEGLDSVDRDGNLDSQLFALSVLLSSYFIYNSMGAIDETSINSLALITNLVKTVCVDNGQSVDTPYQLSQYAPKFLWILRDFVLDIKDLKGNSVSPNVYLESVLTDLPLGQGGYTRNTEISTKIRQSIMSFFKNRDCITMIRPVHDETELRNVADLPDDRIRDEFLDQLYVVRNKIYQSCQQKIINGIGLDSSKFLVYLQQFIEAFNNGVAPVIKTAWETLLQNDCEKHYKIAVDMYESQNKSFSEKNEDKLSLLDMHRYLNQLRDYIMNEYLKCAYVEERHPEAFHHYKNLLKEFVDDKQKQILEEYNFKAKSMNGEMISELYQDVIMNQDFSESLPQDIVKSIEERVFNKYANENHGGEILKTFVEHSDTQNNNLFNVYLDSLETKKKRIQKSLVREQELEKDQLRQEQFRLNDDKARFDTVIREVQMLDENIEHLEDNSEENKLEPLYEINIKLKEELDKNQKIRDTNAGKLRKLTEEMEEIKRKKKGWC